MKRLSEMYVFKTAKVEIRKVFCLSCAFIIWVSILSVCPPSAWAQFESSSPIKTYNHTAGRSLSVDSGGRMFIYEDDAGQRLSQRQKAFRQHASRMRERGLGCVRVLSIGGPIRRNAFESSVRDHALIELPDLRGNVITVHCKKGCRGLHYNFALQRLGQSTYSGTRPFPEHEPMGSTTLFRDMAQAAAIRFGTIVNSLPQAIDESTEIIIVQWGPDPSLAHGSDGCDHANYGY